MFPQITTFFTAYKILTLPLLPSKTKETTFQMLNRMIWTANKANKSGKSLDPICHCKELETMRHLLGSCENDLAKIWAPAKHALTL